MAENGAEIVIEMDDDASSTSRPSEEPESQEDAEEEEGTRTPQAAPAMESRPQRNAQTITSMSQSLCLYHGRLEDVGDALYANNIDPC